MLNAEIRPINNNTVVKPFIGVPNIFCSNKYTPKKNINKNNMNPNLVINVIGTLK